MITTTPPGRGSRPVSLADDDPVLARDAENVDGVRVDVSGALTDDDRMLVGRCSWGYWPHCRGPDR